MVRYSSRVGAGGAANVKRPGPKGKKKGGLVKKGGDIAIGGGMEVGGNVDASTLLDAIKATPAELENIKDEIGAGLQSGGNLSTGGAPLKKTRTGAIESSSGIKVKPPVAKSAPVLKGRNPSGGGLFSDSLDSITKSSSAITGIPSPTSDRILDVKKGGAIVGNLQGVVSKLTHNGMIQILNHMTPQQFHVLQGVAGSFLPQFEGHPLTGVARKTLGGSFTHPRNISKMATRDITRAVSAQQLATALHAEMMDSQKGLDVGGGLLDSLKHGFNRGFDGLKSGIASGNRLGSVLHGALSTGIQVGQVFQPVVESLFPGSGALIKSGISSAEALKAGLETGIRAGEALEKGLESISALDTSGAGDKPVSPAEVVEDLEVASAVPQPAVVEPAVVEPAVVPPVGQPTSERLIVTPRGGGLTQAELRILGF